MFGFETIGNATLIVHDGEPVLTTDPWISGEPYFGSWDLPYEIPSDQIDSILRSDHIWFSHGHPDHLNESSLRQLTHKKILLPDHAGGRIARQMEASGLDVRVLPTRRWVDLSRNVKVMCLPDFNQDATLLIAMGQHLIVDFNDSQAPGYTATIRRICAGFKHRYLLALRNYGEVETNLYDEQGNSLAPPAAAKPSVGKQYASLAKQFKGTHLIPFSCVHRYQREDSAWASAYSTPLSAHSEGYDHAGADLLPAFVRVDLEHDTVTELRPRERPLVLKSPEAFGDVWSDPLEADDVALCEAYFKKKEHLAKTIGFVNLRVGGREHRIVLNRDLRKGLSFEAPRNSLMAAVDYEIFDDLLIGNFMKVTLHDMNGLYPDFTPYVAKYADNGGAQSEEELRAYFRAYREKSTAEFILSMLRHQSEEAFRRHFSNRSRVFRFSREVYHLVLG